MELGKGGESKTWPQKGAIIQTTKSKKWPNKFNTIHYNLSNKLVTRWQTKDVLIKNNTICVCFFDASSWLGANTKKHRPKSLEKSNNSTNHIFTV